MAVAQAAAAEDTDLLQGEAATLDGGVLIVRISAISQVNEKKLWSRKWT